MMRRAKQVLVIITMAAAVTPALAGHNCDTTQPLKTSTLERGLRLAQLTAQALNASGADVVVLARAGQDLSKYGLRYQQSNQWATETLAMALRGKTTAQGSAGRVQAQSWLQAQGYRPTVLRIGALTRLGGRVGSANIAFDDHPTDQRFSDQIATVTVDSVFDWMPRAGLTTQAVWYKRDHSTP